MKKRKAILLLLIVALFVAIFLISINKQQQGPPPYHLQFPPPHKNYAPIINNGICPEGAGIAWMEGGGSNDLATLCGNAFYNYQYVLTTGGGRIPIIWCDYDDRIGFDNLAHLNDLGPYPGPVLALNEPDLENQCNRTPTQVAQIWHTIITARPDFQMVGPNISQFGIAELGQFIDEYERLYGMKPQPYRWAVHHYSFTGSSTFAQTMNSLCSVLTSRGYICENIWVTEYGSNDPGMMHDLAIQVANDPRVERFFFFTNRGPFTNLNAFINGTNTLTPIGEALLDGLLSSQ